MDIREQIAEFNSEILFCDGFDEAIIGVAERIGNNPIVAYDTEKIIEILVEKDGMSYEEALEYFD